MSSEITPVQSYAMLTLIASHWYRIAYPTSENRPLSRKERIALMLAIHYDTLAAQTIKPYWTIDRHNRFLNQALETYHNLYTVWRDNNFDSRMFASFTNSIRSTF